MKTKNEEIDDLIISALSEEEAAYYHDLDEQSIPDMVLGIYRGKMGLLAILMSIVMLIILGITVYCTVKFFKVESLVLMLKWGAGALTGLITISMLKIWSWMQMDKNALIREIKRLEFQLSIIASKIKQG